jgi:hypothetical protein
MFVHRDTFYVALSPSVAPIRQLTLSVQLNRHDPKQAARLLAPLLKLKTHASYLLSITLSIPDEDRGELVIYTLAVTLEAPTVVDGRTGGEEGSTSGYRP